MVPFHITALADAGLPMERIKVLVGHSQGKDVTQSIYRAKPSVGVLQADIERLHYEGLDLSHLHTVSTGATPSH